jgi:PAS domain S-box-containing protein
MKKSKRLPGGTAIRLLCTAVTMLLSGLSLSAHDYDYLRTQRMLSAILETAPTGIGVVEDRVFVQVNDYILKLTGYTRQELLGQSARMLYPTQEESDYVGREKYRQIAEKGTGTVEVRWLHKDGTIRHVMLSSTPLNPEALEEGVTFTVLDITDRKAAEAALASRTRWFLLGLGGFVIILLILVGTLAINLRQRKAAQAVLRKNEELLSRQLSEKETLLREVHHRVKNNILGIEALLSMQASSDSNKEVKAALQDAISRIRSMGELYEKLLLSNEYREVSIKNYTEGLIESIFEVFPESDKIAVEKQIEDFTIDAKKAVFVGIILNELVTNALKYAFEGRGDGKLSITLERDEAAAKLTVQDNGVGLDLKKQPEKSSGFGLTLVKMLVEQLDGEYRIDIRGGTRSEVNFRP